VVKFNFKEMKKRKKWKKWKKQKNGNEKKSQKKNLGEKNWLSCDDRDRRRNNLSVYEMNMTYMKDIS